MRLMSNSFLAALRRARQSGRNAVIPDIKCISPKEGDLLRGRNPLTVACALRDAGAPVLSVVTEAKSFGGSLDLLRQVAAATGLPILRKDFVKSRQDIDETKAAGAAAILLICACMPQDLLADLYQYALSVGVQPLVETCNAQELAFAGELGAELVGINNRNITELERDDGDVSRTGKLAKLADQGAFLISESSIRCGDEVRAAIACGADAALVGTAIWQAADPMAFYHALCQPLEIKICGLRSRAEIDMCMAQGVETLGIVCEYPLAVPWDIDREAARELCAYVPPEFKTCLVTGGSREKILDLANFVKPDLVQLHYRETLADTEAIGTALRKAGIGVVKTIPQEAAERIRQFGTADIAEICRSLAGSGVEAMLVDARSFRNADRPSGLADCAMYNEVCRHSRQKVILAGGITPENVGEMLARSNAVSIDLMTGVETAGKKDESKISKLIANIEKHYENRK